MGRGSLQLRHRQGCKETGTSARRCSCAPTVYAVYYLAGKHKREKLGYLERGWKSDDLRRFEDELVDGRHRLVAGKPLRREPVKLSEYAERWFEELYASADAGRISTLTFNTYEGHWTNHLEPAFGDTPMAAIDQRDVRTYVSRKVAGGFAPSTVNATLTPLSAMFSDALAEGLVHTHPVRQPRRARHGASRRTAILADVERRPPKHLEPVEAQALLAATPEGEPRQMVLAALTTGFRRGELLGLRWEDLVWGKDRVELRRQLQRRKEVPCKNHSERDVVLFSGLKRELGRRRRAEGYVFTDLDGEPWTDSGPERAFLVESYERAGLRRKIERGEKAPDQPLWHALRHTYVSILSNAGMREDVVAGLVGHARQGTTALYSHLFADAFEGVEEALAGVFGDASACNDDVTSAPSEGRESSRSVAQKHAAMRS